MVIKTIKIKVHEYANLTKLLKRVGLVEGNKAYPSNLYVSQTTYKDIKKALIKQFRKENPLMRHERAAYYAGLELLNLGPNIVDKGIKRGYAIVIPTVDTITIRKGK